MGLKRVFAFAAPLLLLTWAGSAAADQYRPEEYLRLDLSKAVLSPKRIGPPAQFAPVAVEAREEPSVDYRRVRTTTVKPDRIEDTEVRAEHKTSRSADRKAARPDKVKQANVEKPRTPARAKVVKRGNPLDAQAMDTRIQKWPCRSGGICDWKR
jgi:hypothetical protein